MKLLFRQLKNEDFCTLSKEIEDLFPTETRFTYYIAPITKKFSKTNKSITSRGKLVDKYRNKIRDYRKLRDTLSESDRTYSTSCTSDFEGEGTNKTIIIFTIYIYREILQRKGEL